MEKPLASAATVGTCSYSSDGGTILFKESPPLFEDEGKDFTKPCEKSSTEQEAKDVEGKRETAEVTLNLKSAPKLDAREISLDKVPSEEFEPEKEPYVPVLQCADKPNRLPLCQKLDSGYYSVDVDESIEAGSEVDSPSQLSTDAPVSEQSSQSLRRGEMEDVVPSNRTECFHLAEAGGKEHQKNGKRENSIDNVQSVKCRITKDNEEIVEIKSCQNQKPSNKTPKKLISYQEFFRMLRKALRESKLPKLVYSFLKNKKYVKKCLKRFGLSNLRLNETYVCVVFPVLHLQSDWDWTMLDMKKEWFRLASFASLTYRRFQKLSSVSLASAGFYYSSEHRKIQCFTCDKCYTPEYLENLLQARGTSNLPKGLHENWCLISDHGNIPMHPNPGCNDVGNPSCNKRPFKDAEGKLIKCKHMCGLNTIFADVSHMLAEFPALKDAFKNCRAGKLILEMLELGKLNSARGIHHILLNLRMVKPEDTEINLQSFKLIEFLCILNKEEIVIERMCGEGCPMQTTLKKEQIIINALKTDGKMNIQQGILEFFEACCPSSKCCDYCQKTVNLTFSHPPPPVLFLNVWRLSCPPHGAVEVPVVVYVLGHRYRLGTEYVHKDQHFTGWIYKPAENQEWPYWYYDDARVSPLDRYSAVFDDTKEYPGNERMVVISYYLDNQ